jgi:hypothetical protein
MRKLMIISALVLMSATAQAQSVDIGSLMSGGGIPGTEGLDQQQLGSMMQGAGGMAQGGAGRQAGRRHAAGHASQSRSARHESADETKARRIAAKYGVSW